MSKYWPLPVSYAMMVFAFFGYAVACVFEGKEIVMFIPLNKWWIIGVFLFWLIFETGEIFLNKKLEKGDLY